MKLLLTSSGISNTSIDNALVDLLGKPIAESNALFIPTAIYPFPRGAVMAGQAISGKAPSPLCELGWKSLGVLELTALPSIEKKLDPRSRRQTRCWFGAATPCISATGCGSLAGRPLAVIAARSGICGSKRRKHGGVLHLWRDLHNPPSGSVRALTSEDIVFATPRGKISRVFVTAQGAGLVDFALIPHLDHEDHPDASLANAEIWAARLPVPVYAIDDETAIKVTGGTVDVVSEGHWKLFTPDNTDTTNPPASCKKTAAFCPASSGPA